MKFASLYSGCGGLDLGFKQAGFECVRSIDFDEKALSNLGSNLGSEITCMDLGLFGAQHSDLLAGADILVAGPPCQGFSTAGRNDPEDYRNDHVWNVARIAGYVKPKVVIIENVRGLLNPKNAKHFDRTIADLKAHGYTVSWAVHNMASFGIAQTRVRVIIVAVLGSSKFELQLPSTGSISIKDALHDVEKLADFAPNPLKDGSVEKHIARHISPGQKLSNVRSGPSSVHTWEIPEVFGFVDEKERRLLETIVRLRRQKRRRDYGDADPVAPEDLDALFGSDTKFIVSNLVRRRYLRRSGRYVDLTNTFNGKFRRLNWDSASPTVDTRFGQPRYFLHPVEDRGFSVREAARLQTFPDQYAFSGSDAAKFRMIGNAVPPMFARMVANSLRNNWAYL